MRSPGHRQEKKSLLSASELKGRHRSPDSLAANGAFDPHLPHKSCDGAARHIGSFACELPPDLADAVNLEILVPDPPNLFRQGEIAPLARRCTGGIAGTGGGIAGTGGMLAVRRRGDRQNPADRLDPVGVAMLVDERLHDLDRRSSSAIAKYAEALRRISFACRSSRTSRSSALIRSRSSLVVPARPLSRSACRTQPRSVSAVQPIFAAIEPIAAHCDPWSP